MLATMKALHDNNFYRERHMIAISAKVTIDPQNLHSYLTPRIGKTRADGLLDIVDQYAEPLLPLPYSSVGETADKRICTASGATL